MEGAAAFTARLFSRLCLPGTGRVLELSAAAFCSFKSTLEDGGTVDKARDPSREALMLYHLIDSATLHDGRIRQAKHVTTSSLLVARMKLRVMGIP
uniref:Uncharacterized protein n=1 Tax=Psilocybe cubensis TaxID=181762 RepID=A0A8H7Y775_PSICU